MNHTHRKHSGFGEERLVLESTCESTFACSWEGKIKSQSKLQGITVFLIPVVKNNMLPTKIKAGS